jgi:hypothetical protein
MFRPQAVRGLGRPFRGVWCPTTLSEAGSDSHRAYLTRLCSAFRLSQPLDALLRLQPFRPCFMPVTPLGFDLQRFSLPGSGPHLSMKPALHAVFHDRNPRPPGCVSSAYDFEDLRIRGVRSEQAGVTRLPSADPLLALSLYEVFPLVAWVCVATDLLSWAWTQRWTIEIDHRCVCSSEFQRATRLACLCSRLPTSVRFVILQRLPR